MSIRRMKIQLSLFPSSRRCLLLTPPTYFIIYHFRHTFYWNLKLSPMIRGKSLIVMSLIFWLSVFFRKASSCKRSWSCQSGTVKYLTTNSDFLNFWWNWSNARIQRCIRNYFLNINGQISLVNLFIKISYDQSLWT